MISANEKIIVEVNFQQKKSISIGSTQMLLAKQYSNNRRESEPVVCKVINGNGHLADGAFILVHHNRFSENSPHHLENNLYSLAFNESIFAKLDKNGEAKSVCGNIIVDYVYDDKDSMLPAHLRLPNKFKYVVKNSGYGYKKGQFIFAYEKADYEIVYVFNGEEKRVIKIKQSDIVGKMTKK